MVLSEDFLRLAETFGPYVLSAVGTVATGLFGIAAAIARYAWRSHREHLETLTTAVVALSDSARESAKATEELYAELKKTNVRTKGLKRRLESLEIAISRSLAPSPVDYGEDQLDNGVKQCSRPQA